MTQIKGDNFLIDARSLLKSFGIAVQKCSLDLSQIYQFKVTGEL
jgi:hypothetical protein